MVLALFALLYDVLNLREGRSLSYWGSYLVLVFLAGFRYRVGGDTYNYMFMYELLPNLSELFSTEVGFAKLQPLWLLFLAFAKSIGEDFYTFQILHAITVNAIIFGFIKKNTNYRHSGVLLYYFSIYPFFNFEILRESLAVCIFLIAVPYYTNKNWWRYYLLVTIAFLFHYSAVFLYLLPFIRNVNFKGISLLFIFAISTMLNPFIQTNTASWNSTFIELLIGGYLEYKYTIFGLISIFIFNLLIPYFLFWFARNNCKINADYVAVAAKWLPIAALIPFVYIFYRFFNYFAILWILMACEVGHGVLKTVKAGTMRLVAASVLFTLALIFSTTGYFKDTSHILSSTRWYIRWQPYYSIFDPVTDPDRELMIEIERANNL